MKEPLKMADSAICQNYVFNAMEHYSYALTPDIVPNLYRVMFFTIANVLKRNMSKSNGKTGFVLKDFNGKFRFGAIATYISPENSEDDDKGNFNLEFTIYEKDLEGIENVYDNFDDNFIYTLTIQAAEIGSIRIGKMEYANNMFIELVDTLVKFLEENVTEDEKEVTFVYPGIFTASCILNEEGEKVIEIIPGEMIRQVIKNDATL